MSEEGRVIVKSHARFLSPINPAGKVGYIVSVAVGTGVFGVNRMKIQLVRGRRKRVDLFDVGAEFGSVSRRIRVVARHHVFGLRGFFLKAAYIVALPAVKRNFDVGKLLYRRIDVHAESGIPFRRKLVILYYVFFVHLSLLIRVFTSIL